LDKLKSREGKKTKKSRARQPFFVCCLIWLFIRFFVICLGKKKKVKGKKRRRRKIKGNPAGSKRWRAPDHFIDVQQQQRQQRPK
jgi:hypothetical protein